MLSGEAFVFTGKPDGHKPYTPRLGHREVPLATVVARLNHARISTTVNVYTHAIRAWDRPAAETLSNIIDNEDRSRLDC